jgi:hypothetical protein
MNTADPNELVLLIVKIAFLALLWAFVLVAVRAVRLDLFGPGKRQQRRPAAARPGAQGGAGAGAATGRAGARPARQAASRQAARAGRPPDTPAPAPSRLVVTKGPKAGTTYPLTGAVITIGRALDSTVVLDEDVASARHARLVPHNGQWFIEDLDSTNGTYLDRMKVTSPMPVPLGAPVRIGKTVLELHR